MADLEQNKQDNMDTNESAAHKVNQPSAMNSGLLASVVSVATAFSTNTQRVNTQGEALFTLANETLPAQSERLGVVALKQIAMGIRLNLLGLRISRLGGSGNETSE